MRASETAAGLSGRMIEFPRRNTAQADAMQRMLTELRTAAQSSAAESQVAAAAAEQLQAIESLSRNAIQLSASVGAAGGRRPVRPGVIPLPPNWRRGCGLAGLARE